MKYCRVTLEVLTRGQVFKKDFDPQHIFGALARTTASDLIQQNVVKEGESYCALIRPRYENTLIENPLLWVDQAAAQAARPAWLTLDFASGSDQPITFFTLELRFPDSGIIYTRDKQILGVDYFWQNLQTALVKMRVLRLGDQYIPRLMFCDDDQADLDYEEFRLLDDDEDEPLFELVEVEDPAEQFPRKSPADFAVSETVSGALVSPAEVDDHDPAAQAGVQIYITRRTLDALHTLAQQDVQIEQGGALVGQIYRNAQTPGQFLIEITDYLVAERASANLLELHYTFDSWLEQTAQLKARHPGKQIVGWYHTHLVQVNVSRRDDTDAGQMTELFFSQDDLFMHRRFFSDRWYVALVLGSRGGAAFFRWFDNQIGASHQYHII